MGYILIADDDSNIAELIADSLEDEGYCTRVVYDGDEVLKYVENDSGQIELILLDIMMPGTDGHEVCRKIRQLVTCPIIFVSAKDTPMNRIIGLEIGADDYITKPFSVVELVARVNAHIRREKRYKKSDKLETISIGKLTISPDSFCAYLEGEKLDLSTREFQILFLLAKNKNRVLSREQIFEGVWGSTYGDLNSVTVHIKNLRTKLGVQNEYIVTVWGVGYKLINPEV